MSAEITSGIIELSSGCKRFDSIVEANEKGDAKALQAALEANIRTVNGILAEAQSVRDRYEPTLLDLLSDLGRMKEATNDQG